MSYFAVHVKTGWEQFTVDQLQKQIEKTLFNGINSIIAPVLEIKRFVGKDVMISKRKMLSSSYIYIKTSVEALEVPGEVYHFLKCIAGILKILPYNIPEEEIESFCNNYNLALEEAEIEIQLNEPVESLQSFENQKSTLLHESNTTSDVREKEEKLEKERNLKRTVDIFLEIIEEGKKGNHRLIKKCKAYIFSNKETFRFPLALFLKTRESIDPNNTLSIKQLTTHSFILPNILKTMKKELTL